MYKYIFRSELTGEATHFAGIVALSSEDVVRVYNRHTKKMRQNLEQCFENYTQEFVDDILYEGAEHIACVKCSSYKVTGTAVYVYTEVTATKELPDVDELEEAVDEFMQGIFTSKLYKLCKLEEQYTDTLHRFSLESIAMEAEQMERTMRIYFEAGRTQLCTQYEVPDYVELFKMRNNGTTTVLEFTDAECFVAYIAQHGDRELQEFVHETLNYTRDFAKKYYVKLQQADSTGEAKIVLWAAGYADTVDIHTEKGWVSRVDNDELSLVTAMMTL